MQGIGEWFGSVFSPSPGETRSICAENPDGSKSGGALASPGDDHHCTKAANKLGRGWKVRPCLRDLAPGASFTLADIRGPGIVQHFWCTVDASRLHQLHLRVWYDGSDIPALDAPLGYFFANGVDGIARIPSLPVAVNPRGGMNSYWPMPFRKQLRIEVYNEGPVSVKELFYQITYRLQNVDRDAAYLHALYRTSTTTRESPEHILIDSITGDGQYIGTYLTWKQYSSGWWGEGEIKFHIDGDPHDKPTICGTGTEDYFGGAWGFLDEPMSAQKPATYAGPLLGYPQVTRGLGRRGEPVPIHAMYRWHLPDPIRFHSDLRVTIQALGWWDDGTYQPLEDDLSSLALWYQRVSDS